MVIVKKTNFLFVIFFLIFSQGLFAEEFNNTFVEKVKKVCKQHEIKIKIVGGVLLVIVGAVVIYKAHNFLDRKLDQIANKIEKCFEEIPTENRETELLISSNTAATVTVNGKNVQLSDEEQQKIVNTVLSVIEKTFTFVFTMINLVFANQKGS